MTPIPTSQIDEVILSVLTPKWRKVAMIIGMAKDVFENKQIEIDEDTLASRVEALCEEGRIESQGNLSNWRGSEVRLPQAPSQHPVIDE
jgi:Protein of unknown function